MTTKTMTRALLAHTQLATATWAIGSAVDVSALLAGRIVLHLGRTVATVFSTEVDFYLQGSSNAYGGNDDEWVTLFNWQSRKTKTACNATTLNGATSAGASSFTLTSTTGFPATGAVDAYFRETGTPANSEWVFTKTASAPISNLTRAHTNGITVSTLAEHFSMELDLSTHKQLRLLANNSNGQTVDLLAWLNTLDAI